MKRFFTFSLITIIVFISKTSSAQSVGMVSYNESPVSTQQFRKIVKTSDGGIVGIVPAGNTYPCTMVVKVDGNFNFVWSVQIDSVGVSDIIETNDGNYVLQGLLPYASIYQGAISVVKLSSAGNLIFQKIYYYNSFATNSLNACGICKGAGTDSGFVLFGGNCVAMRYLMKCDMNGNIQWSKQYLGAIGSGAISSLVSDASGYTGVFNYLSNYSNVGILRVDPLGNVIWAKTMDGTNDLYVPRFCLVENGNGDYFFGTQPSDSSGVQNYFVKNSGATITCKRHISSGTPYLQFSSLFETNNSNGDLIECGIEGGTIKAFVIKLDTNNSIVYAKEMVDSSTTFGPTVSLSNGTYVLCGGELAVGKFLAVIDENGNGICSATNYPLSTSNYNLIIGTPTFSISAVPAFIATSNFAIATITQVRANLCGALGMNNQEVNTDELNVYPNPTCSSIAITSEETMNEIKVMNVMGQVCLDLKGIKAESYYMNLSGFENGIYFLKVYTNKGISIKKIMKQ
jgi:hypothetical protein